MVIALSTVRDSIMGGGDYISIEGIVVYNDNRYMNEIVHNIRTTDSPDLFRLNNDMQELRKFFLDSNIHLVIKWRRGDRLKDAHDLAYTALYGGGYYQYVANKKIMQTAKSGDCLIPFSVFTRAELVNLTANEILVMYMVDERKYQISKLAKELHRDYNTIHTVYTNAKRKSAGLTPPRKFQKAMKKPEC